MSPNIKEGRKDINSQVMPFEEVKEEEDLSRTSIPPIHIDTVTEISDM